MERRIAIDDENIVQSVCYLFGNKLLWSYCWNQKKKKISKLPHITYFIDA